MESFNMKDKVSESSEPLPTANVQPNDIRLKTKDIRAVRKIVRKIDFHLLPPLFALFLLAFIDRINIGNARIQGLERDLHMKGNAYNIALFIFFIPYILLEVPCNIIIKKLAPSTWLSGIMVCWGVITICQGVTGSFAGLVVCRFLLGVFEAGFVPGCIYLISMYYKRHELQWRVNLFFAASILAGSFSGLLAYALANMAGIRGYNGWRWIFIIEGIMTVIVAAVSKFFIADWPEQAKFLTEDERAIVLARLAEDAGEANMNTYDRKATRRVFTDPKIYLGVFMYLGVVNTGYSTSFFTPTILKQLGWTAIRAQVMSIPIYIVATVAALTTAICTDLLKHRFAFTIIGCVVATIGYIILLNQHRVSVAGRYVAIYLITTGGYITQPITIVWLNNNMGGHYKRAVAAGMQIGLGNAGGLIASNIYITNQAPTYPVGFGVSLGLIWLCGLCCTIFFLILVWENKQRKLGKRDHRLQLPEDEQRNLGDDHPSFRFTY